MYNGLKVFDEFDNELTVFDLGLGSLSEVKTTMFTKNGPVTEHYYRYIPFTPEEIAEKEKLAARYGMTDDDIMKLMLDSVTVADKPAEKEGFITVPHYEQVGHSIVWTFEPDPNYVTTEDGTYLKPFSFTPGMEVEVGMWYTDGEDIWECIEAGIAEGFTAPWFDVIEV